MAARLLVLCVAVFLTGFLSGCGPGGPERVDVTGTVTYKGKPIEDGAIQLIPKGGGPMHPISVKNGSFSATGQHGVIVGDYQAVFHSYQVRDRKNSEQAGAMIPEMMTQVELLPKKYCSEESTEELKLESGAGSKEVTFDLK